MNATNSPNLPAPPRLIETLTSGFETVTNHLYLMIFPITLDLFLWLGPHISIGQWVDGLLKQFAAMRLTTSTSNPDLVQASQEVWKFLAERYNLMANLHAFPLGVPSLMASRLPVETPMGTPWVWNAPGWAAIPIGIGLFTLGLWFGVGYYRGVVAAIQKSGDPPQHPWWWFGVSGCLLVGLWLLLFIVIFFPASFVISLLSLVNPAIGQFALMLLMIMLLWIYFPLLFAPQALLLNQVSAWQALKDSFQVVRMTFSSTFGFVVTVFILYQGLNRLWSVPAENSWVNLVGIGGHAFIAASLLTASFIYFQQAYGWSQAVVQWIKTQQAQSKL